MCYKLIQNTILYNALLLQIEHNVLQYTIVYNTQMDAKMSKKRWTCATVYHEIQYTMSAIQTHLQGLQRPMTLMTVQYSYKYYITVQYQAQGTNQNAFNTIFLSYFLVYSEHNTHDTAQQYSILYMMTARSAVPHFCSSTALGFPDLFVIQQNRGKC